MVQFSEVRRWGVALLGLVGYVYGQCNSPVLRKEIRSMSNQELSSYLNALRQLHTIQASNAASVYDTYALVYSQAQGVAHGNPSFLPWHRWFLRNIEQDLRRIDPNIILPYWDWSMDYIIPNFSQIFSSNYFGGAGNPNNNYCVPDGPFAQYPLAYPQRKCLMRQFNYNSNNVNTFGATNTNNGLNSNNNIFNSNNGMNNNNNNIFNGNNGFSNDNNGFNNGFGNSNFNNANGFNNFNNFMYQNTFFSPKALDYVLALPTYADFAERIEIISVAVRTAIGGFGGDLSYMVGPNDPIFFIHHTFIDMLWNAWQLRHPGSSQYNGVGTNGQTVSANDVLQPFNIPVSSALLLRRIPDLCYGYSDYSPSLSNSAAVASANSNMQQGGFQNNWYTPLISGSAGATSVPPPNTIPTYFIQLNQLNGNRVSTVLNELRFIHAQV